MLHSIYQQIWKTQLWPQDWKRSVFISFPKKAVSKNVQITVHLHSFHMLAGLCSKSFKLSFSSMWTEHFQTFKLDFKEAEEPEIKLPTYFGSWRKQGSSRKTSVSASLTMLKPLTVWIKTNWKILEKMEISDHLTCLLRNLYAGQKETVKTGYGTIDWFKIGK